MTITIVIDGKAWLHNHPGVGNIILIRGILTIIFEDGRKERVKIDRVEEMYIDDY